MMQFKRALALFLAICMVLSVMNLGVFAEGTEEDGPEPAEIETEVEIEPEVKAESTEEDPVEEAEPTEEEPEEIPEEETEEEAPDEVTISEKAAAAEAVAYIERSWDGSKVVSQSKTVTKYTVVNQETLEWSDGWYVVKGSVEFEGRVSVSGDVQLVLTDGCRLNVPKGIGLNPGASLSIYAQE